MGLASVLEKVAGDKSLPKVTALVGAAALLGAAAAFTCGIYYGSTQKPRPKPRRAGGFPSGPEPTSASAPPRVLTPPPPSAPLPRRHRRLPLAAELDPEDSYKMVLCVRMDLKMSKGKIAAQCCHACLGVWKKLWRRRDPVLRVWEEGGQPKVTLQVSDEEAMLELYQRAKQIGVPTYIVVDAGRTQVAPNSRTVMAVGPASEKEVNEVTGRLKLL